MAVPAKGNVFPTFFNQLIFPTASPQSFLVMETIHCGASPKEEELGLQSLVLRRYLAHREGLTHIY